VNAGVALAGPKCWARDIFIGVNAVDYSAIPTAVPESSRRSERMATSPPAPASRASSCMSMHRWQYLSKADIIRRGAALGRRLRADVSCYQADAEGGRADAAIPAAATRRVSSAAGIPIRPGMPRNE